MKITDKRFEETIERRRVIVEETIERKIIEHSIEERVALLENKFEEYVFLSDEQIKEIRDLIQLYYDIYDNKRIWQILKHECKFSKLERAPRYKYPIIKKILYDFVGSYEPKHEDHPNKKQNFYLGDKRKLIKENNSFSANKKKKHHKKRGVDTSGCPSILSFAFQEE